MAKTGKREPPAISAAALYCGKVMHARLRPVGHRFTYRVMALLIDLDRLCDANRQSRLFAVNRRALCSFHEIDHGERNGNPLSKYVRNLAGERGVDLSGGRIQLLCYPRLFGYTFNPLSIYFCYGADGDLTFVIYEVSNTSGETHSYVLDVESGHDRGEVLRQSQAKQFYVSPFMKMETRYHFRLSPPGEHVKIKILQTDEHGAMFAAAFSGRRRTLTTRSLLGAFFEVPLFTFKVIAAIHWQALRLWLKGVPLVPRSKRP